MSTTNGTRAHRVSPRKGERVLPCAFTNLGAVASVTWLTSDERIVVICAGQDDSFSLDDALCAGHLTQLASSDATPIASRISTTRPGRSERWLRRERPTRAFIEQGLLQGPRSSRSAWVTI